MVRHDVRVDHAIIPRPYLFPEESDAAPTPEETWWLDMLRVRWPFLHTMREQGVTVFLGTDAVHGPWPRGPAWPGFQELARAAEIIVRHADFTPAQAIQMMTGHAARALCMERDIGAIQPGRRADLILLAGDPLTNIQALRDVEMVFRDGILVAQGGHIVLTPPPAGNIAPRGWELPV
jgi:cytosine/adenosine deaminase-related metal-dependent hydrolase